MSALPLDHFVQAQAGVIGAAMSELQAGHKRTHWMWFVFPQLAALGRSATARYYGLASLDEARAYAHHAVLGPRLRECARAVLTHPDMTPLDIFGSPDNLKLQSCMTLFSLAVPDEPVFREVLSVFYDGIPDAATVRLCT
jgi:uncharacterized protein (DUF1810 family)